MRHELREFHDADTAASAAADYIAARARDAIAAHGAFSCAMSGGHTPQHMLGELAARDVEWARTMVFQVDERVTPLDDARRNLSSLRRMLGSLSTTIEAMPVDGPDLDAAARRYGARLPARFDLVHLGLGPDGHTASLVPGDAVLDVMDRLVGLSGPYQDTRRMTLTYPALARADQILWLITGGEKRDALARLLAGDTSIPAGRVEAGESLIFADRSALS